jgi:hypothetical protein
MRQKDWKVTTATVSGCAYGGRDQRGRHWYEVNFDYTVDGEPFTGTFASPGIRDVNVTFPLRYDPERPAKNELAQKKRPFNVKRFLLIGTIVLLAVVFGGMAIWGYLSEP